MLDLHYGYAECVRNSERISWKVDDVMPLGGTLDFSKPFLPDSLAGTSALTFLDASARLKLNQIMGNSYLNLFAFVEEYILAQMTNHAHAELFGDHNALRALTRFADEELKHQQLFWRFRDVFDRDFGTPCLVLSNAAQVARVVLSKSPLAVLFVTYHLELMTQLHYTESIRGDESVEPSFASLLHHHWLEEAQHARIDVLEIDKLAATAGPEVIEAAFGDYLDLVKAVDGLLEQQAELDVGSLEGALARPLREDERRATKTSQHEAYRRIFLTAGMTNRAFQQTLGRISAAGAERIAASAATLGREA